MICTVFHANHCKQFHRALSALFWRHIGIHKRNLYISHSTHTWNQTKILEYKPNLLVTDVTQLFIF